MVSAFGGLWHLDGRAVDEGELEALRAGLAGRTTRPFACWRRGPLALIGDRLATPPWGALVGDLGLTGRRPLACRLDVAPATDPPQLAAAAVSRWGAAAPAHLAGDFALACWDARRQRLLCARDRFGVRPLYLLHRPGRLFAFASRAGALLGLPGVSRELDEVRVAEFLAGVPDPVRTFYREIRALPPAHQLLVDAAGLHQRRYWRLDPRRALSEAAAPAALEERFRALLEAAVGDRLADADNAVLTGGGLDSTAVAGAAALALRARGGGPLLALTLTFVETPACDELRFARAVGRGLEGHLRLEPVAGDRLGPYAPAALLFGDEAPALAPNSYFGAELIQRARALGARRVLTGVDGDTVVSMAFGVVRELARRGHPLQAARELSHLARRYGWHRLHLAAAMLIRLPLRRRLGRTRLPPFLRRDLVRRTDLAARARAATAPVGWSERAEHHARVAAAYHGELLAEIDRFSAAVGVSAAHPFYDHQLVEHCLALPAALKREDGWDRLVSRRAAAPLRGARASWRTEKTLFDQVITRALFVRQRAELERSLARGGAIDRFVAPRRLRKAYEYCRVDPDRRFRQPWSLWYVSSLSRWLQREEERR